MPPSAKGSCSSSSLSSEELSPDESSDEEEPEEEASQASGFSGAALTSAFWAKGLVLQAQGLMLGWRGTPAATGTGCAASEITAEGGKDGATVIDLAVVVSWGTAVVAAGLGKGALAVALPVRLSSATAHGGGGAFTTTVLSIVAAR